MIDDGTQGLDDFTGLDFDIIDAELDLVDNDLRSGLQSLLAPPDDLAEVVTDRVARKLLDRETMSTMISLIGLGWPTAKAILGPED